MLTGEELRLKRLLLLANSSTNKGRWRDHKGWYSQYYKINGLYTKWCLGMAFLTVLGEEKLKQLMET
jgi:hypothetical protein